MKYKRPAIILGPLNVYSDLETSDYPGTIEGPNQRSPYLWLLSVLEVSRYKLQSWTCSLILWATSHIVFLTTTCLYLSIVCHDFLFTPALFRWLFMLCLPLPLHLNFGLPLYHQLWFSLLSLSISPHPVSVCVLLIAVCSPQPSSSGVSLFQSFFVISPSSFCLLVSLNVSLDRMNLMFWGTAADSKTFTHLLSSGLSYVIAHVK